MGKRRKPEVSADEAQKIVDAAKALTPAEQRAAIGAYFEGSHAAKAAGKAKQATDAVWPANDTKED